MYKLRNPCEDHNPGNRCERWAKSLGYAEEITGIPDLRGWNSQSVLNALDLKKKTGNKNIPKRILNSEVGKFYETLIKQINPKTQNNIKITLEILCNHFSVYSIAGIKNIFLEEVLFQELLLLPNIGDISIYAILIGIILSEKAGKNEIEIPAPLHAVQRKHIHELRTKYLSIH